MVVAEGARYNAAALVRYFRKKEASTGFELRATSLGHVQRGGTPGAFDRLLATRLGAAAADQLTRGRHGVLMGLIKGEVKATPLSTVAGRKKGLDQDLWDLAKVLAK